MHKSTTAIGAATEEVAPERPINSSERLEIIDGLRGFALFGILVANLLSFSGYLFLPPDHATSLSTAPVDRVTLFLIRVFVDGKFYSLFSFLFGFGFAIQLTRSDLTGTSFAPRFLRRLGLLLAFGLVHAVFLEWGDILSVYALTGLLLIPFRKCRDTALLIWILILLALPIVQYSTMVLTFAGYDPTGPKFGPNETEQVIQTYGSGRYWDILMLNLVFLKYRWIDLLYTSRFPKVLAMFLLGLYSSRRGIFSNVAANRPLFLRVLWIGLAVGLVANVLLAILAEMPVYHPPSPLGILETTAYVVGVPALCLAYIAVFALTWDRQRWLAFLAPAGRIALTNYISQTVICLLIFCGYGLGYFGHVGAFLSTLLAIVIFLCQILASRWWLRHFAFGPLEWLLRMFTYWKPMPILRDAAGA